jgi:hypothetical protein
MAGKELRTASSRLYLEYFFDMEDTASTFSLRYWNENKEMNSIQQALPGVLL